MYKMHKSYGQICNFMSYYIIYVGHIFLKNRFLPSNLPNLGGLQICGHRGNGFFHFISSIVTKQRKGLHFFSFLFFSSLLQPFQSPCPWVKLSYIQERKNKEVLKVLIRLGQSAFWKNYQIIVKKKKNEKVLTILRIRLTCILRIYINYLF